MNDLILYTTEDGHSQIKLRADSGTVWLTQLEMVELFQTSKRNIAKHLKGIFAEQELSQDSVVNQRLTTAAASKNDRLLSILYAPCKAANADDFSAIQDGRQRGKS